MERTVICSDGKCSGWSIEVRICISTPGLKRGPRTRRMRAGSRQARDIGAYSTQGEIELVYSLLFVLTLKNSHTCHIIRPQTRYILPRMLIPLSLSNRMSSSPIPPPPPTSSRRPANARNRHRQDAPPRRKARPPSLPRCDHFAC
jgi:hypothetical protein